MAANPQMGSQRAIAKPPPPTDGRASFNDARELDSSSSQMVHIRGPIKNFTAKTRKRPRNSSESKRILEPCACPNVTNFFASLYSRHNSIKKIIKRNNLFLTSTSLEIINVFSGQIFFVLVDLSLTRTKVNNHCNM